MNHVYTGGRTPIKAEIVIIFDDSVIRVLLIFAGTVQSHRTASTLPQNTPNTGYADVSSRAFNAAGLNKDLLEIF